MTLNSQTNMQRKKYMQTDVIISMANLPMMQQERFLKKNRSKTIIICRTQPEQKSEMKTAL